MSENLPFWHKALLPQGASVQDAIRSLNGSATQIVLVVSGSQGLVGTVTDGDIRRGLLSGLTLSSAIDPIVNRDPMVVPPELDREVVLHLMRANRIHQLPVVDEHRVVVGLHLLDDLVTPQKASNIMVIMAGGRGTRLRPHTEHCPKPLLPVGGKPMIEHIIERARGEGFSKFVVSVHYLGHMIEEHLGDGSRWDVSIDYLHETEPLGTAGAVALLGTRPSEPFIVSNGDIVTDIRYRELLEFHTVHRATATMAVRLHEWQQPYGVVNTRGVDIIGFEEKPVVTSQVNAGVYALAPAALDHLVRGQRCDMPTLFQRLSEAGARTVVYPMHEPWIDVGRPTDLEEANGTYDGR
jgi:dTDP-glucose pyrophosphorylase